MGGRVDGFVNIGGVNFQRDAIKVNRYGLAVTGPDIVVVSKPDEKFKAVMEYSVTLKEGTTITFPKQEDGKHAFVSVSCKGGNYEQPNKIEFNSLNGAKITDTKNDDVYELWRCTNTNVNAKRDSVTTHGYMSGPGIAYHEYDRTHSVDRDKIKVIGGDNVNVEYTSGFDILEIKTNEEIENNHTKLMEKAKDLLSE